MNRIRTTQTLRHSLVIIRTDNSKITTFYGYYTDWQLKHYDILWLLYGLTTQTLRHSMVIIRTDNSKITTFYGYYTDWQLKHYDILWLLYGLTTQTLRWTFDDRNSYISNELKRIHSLKLILYLLII